MFRRFRYLIVRVTSPVRIREMNSCSFVQQLNPVNKKMEWKVVEDDYDYNQEIATSCYGDMLHDDERNKKFGQALKKAIDKFHAAGKKAHILDIGTGTGLLSMLAVKYGADSVVACEAFLPMANCAVNVIQENNFSDKIKVIKSHSTSLTVGEDGNLKQKANVLVSEVFDTELIGEGAINTFNHAFENLLTEDCIVIPSAGTVYAQVVESDLALKWNKLEDWENGDECIIKVPDEIKKCPGAPAVHDIQLSEFSRKHFKVLSEAVPIFNFDWAKNKKTPTHRTNKSVIKAICSGKAQVIFMWWDLKMDQEGEIVISCAPVWEHPDTKGKDSGADLKKLTKLLPWRDHWMQAVYFLTNETNLNQKDSFTLISNHDEFSFWFQIESPNMKNLENYRPVCDCVFHFLLSRTRIGAMNDDRRRNFYYHSLKKLVTSDTICIVLSDITLLGVLCSKLGAKKVFILSEIPSDEKVSGTLLVENKVENVASVFSDVSQIIKAIETETESGPFTALIVSEPFFRNCILPWDNLAMWYIKEDIVNSFKKIEVVNSFRTLPLKCRMKCCAVQFDNLWKIATPLNTCEGFSMKIFDDLIGSAKSKAEMYTESQPLWEYPGIALTPPQILFEFDLSKRIPKEKVKVNGNLQSGCSGRCDGIALWMEYESMPDSNLSFGPTEEIVVGEYIAWDMFERQGVHLFRKQFEVKTGDPIHYEAEFEPLFAEFNFNFKSE